MLRFLWGLKREFQELISHPAVLGLTLFIPILVTLLMGVGSGLLAGVTPVDPRPVLVVVDQDGGGLAKNVLAKLEKSPLVRSMVMGPAEAQELIDNERAQAILILPKDFEKMLEASQAIRLIIQEAPNSQSAEPVSLALRQALSDAHAVVVIANQSAASAEKIKPFASPEERQIFVQQAKVRASELLATPVVTVQTEAPKSAVKTGAIPDGFKRTLPGQLVTWGWVVVMAGAGGFTVERQTGAWSRLRFFNASFFAIFLGRAVGRGLLGLLVMLLLSLIGIIMGVSWGNILWFSLALLAALVFGLGMASLIGVLAPGKQAATVGGITLAGVFSLLCGAWFSPALLPSGFQGVVAFMPGNWFMLALANALSRPHWLICLLPLLALFGTGGISFLAASLLVSQPGLETRSNH
jgi:hypothetical protein